MVELSDAASATLEAVPTGVRRNGLAPVRPAARAIASVERRAPSMPFPSTLVPRRGPSQALARVRAHAKLVAAVAATNANPVRPSSVKRPSLQAAIVEPSTIVDQVDDQVLEPAGTRADDGGDAVVGSSPGLSLIHI